MKVGGGGRSEGGTAGSFRVGEDRVGMRNGGV